MKVFTYIKDNSSRIPKKNFKQLGKLPLWKHLIYEIANSYEVFIDTDSDEVIRECKLDSKLNNVTAYLRDKKFIDMEEDIFNKLSPALLMVENFLEKYVDDENEIIVLTHVTSPFLTCKTIKKAISFLTTDIETVHSVTCKQDFAWLSSFEKPINFNPSVVQRTQDLDKIFFSNGAFFIFKKKTFMKYKNRLGKNNFLYELDHIEGIEIDNFDDLEFAKLIHKSKIN